MEEEEEEENAASAALSRTSTLWHRAFAVLGPASTSTCGGGESEMRACRRHRILRHGGARRRLTGLDGDEIYISRMRRRLAYQSPSCCQFLDGRVALISRKKRRSQPSAAPASARSQLENLAT
jgi:hypothetical protein